MVLGCVTVAPGHKNVVTDLFFLPMPSRQPSQSKVSQNTANVGVLGEAIVARWLQRQGWTILQQRWHCRWGELDLIVGQPLPNSHQFAMIAFVEVKTRRDRNWDEDGKLAITAKKQAKLWKAAQSFLATQPHLADLPCRFDVAIVQCEKLAGTVDLSQVDGDTTTISNGYQLRLDEYLTDAFRLE